MADIRHRVGITAPIAGVIEALTTTEGIAGWWTRTVDGDAAEGGRLRFFFGQPEPSAEMDVTIADPAGHVRWQVVAGPDEWVGTYVDFACQQSGDETVVLFTHGDWRDEAEFMHHCSTKWGQFLVGMKAGFEGGKSIAFPDDPPISSWG